MKKRTLCLLLAGTMALSLLSGCGSKNTADDKTENPLNSFAAGVGNGGANDGGNGGGDEEFDLPNPWNGEDEDLTPDVDEGPFARDPRWDELKPGETAVQYYDIFIKSGMTMGEVVEAVESSDVYQEQFIAWKENTIYYDPDHEFSCKAPRIKMTGEPQEGERADFTEMGIMCDGKTIISFWIITTLPGEEGTIYHSRDLPVILVSPSYNLDSTLTFMGPVGDIKNMGQQDVEGLLDVFQARDPNTEMKTERRTSDGKNLFCYNFSSYLPLSISWDGYSLWYNAQGSELAKSLIAYSYLAVEADGDKLDKYWHIDRMNQNGRFYWVADDAG